MKAQGDFKRRTEKEACCVHFELKATESRRWFSADNLCFIMNLKTAFSDLDLITFKISLFR